MPALLGRIEIPRFVAQHFIVFGSTLLPGLLFCIFNGMASSEVALFVVSQVGTGMAWVGLLTLNVRCAYGMVKYGLLVFSSKQNNPFLCRNLH